MLGPLARHDPKMPESTLRVRGDVPAHCVMSSQPDGPPAWDWVPGTAQPGGAREGRARAGRDVTFSWLLKMSISCSLDLVSFSTSSSCSRSCWRASSFAAKALLRVRSESPVSEKQCKVRKPGFNFLSRERFLSVKAKGSDTYCAGCSAAPASAGR